MIWYLLKVVICKYFEGSNADIFQVEEYLVEPKKPVFKEFAKLGSVISYSVIALPCAK